MKESTVTRKRSLTWRLGRGPTTMSMVSLTMRTKRMTKSKAGSDLKKMMTRMGDLQAAGLTLMSYMSKGATAMGPSWTQPRWLWIL
jgi:hypothetical protein